MQRLFSLSLSLYFLPHLLSHLFALFYRVFVVVVIVVLLHACLECKPNQNCVDKEQTHAIVYGYMMFALWSRVYWIIGCHNYAYYYWSLRKNKQKKKCALCVVFGSAFDSPWSSHIPTFVFSLCVSKKRWIDAKRWSRVCEKYELLMSMIDTHDGHVRISRVRVKVKVRSGVIRKWIVWNKSIVCAASKE